MGHMLHSTEIVLTLLFIMALISLFSKLVSIPSPIMMTLAGLGLSMIPAMPEIKLNPDQVFLLFLPPLLYTSGASTSWRDFRLHMRAIVTLATGLVIATSIAIAATAMYTIPGMTWPLALLLGAIISPPDAVAVTAIAKRLNLPKRIVVILEGESLMNDATSLVLFKLALSIILSGVFSWNTSVTEFVQMAGGGIAAGILIGFLAVKLRMPIDDPSVEVVLSLLTPYAAYLAAEFMHCSGILSVVACGLYVGWHLPSITSSQSRLVSYTIWEVISFILNNVIFLLIGLQLMHIVESIQMYRTEDLVLYTAITSLTMIAVRVVWVYFGAYTPHLLSKRVREQETKPPANWVLFVGWAGMRGVVSLAAAMAIPVTLNDGTPFPYRDLILFITFVAIIITIVIQGLSLGYIAKLLKIPKDESETMEERAARHHITATALQYLKIFEGSDYHHPTAIEALQTDYSLRLNALDNRDSSPYLSCIQSHQDLRRDLINLQRQELLNLRRNKKIGDEVMRKLIRELDFEEMHQRSPV
ncbi:MAG: Na+/H+ antiporter [Alphaproteobacteria bacterium]|nr:MAG: Na+/H+ antiporter [Alphaproteobacteria bacterium]